jgi:hypothetical protein
VLLLEEDGADALRRRPDLGPSELSRNCSVAREYGRSLAKAP